MTGLRAWSRALVAVGVACAVCAVGGCKLPESDSGGSKSLIPDISMDDFDAAKRELMSALRRLFPT